MGGGGNNGQVEVEINNSYIIYNINETDSNHSRLRVKLILWHRSFFSLNINMAVWGGGVRANILCSSAQTSFSLLEIKLILYHTFHCGTEVGFYFLLGEEHVTINYDDDAFFAASVIF